jgi:hypothetical protein
MRAFGCSRKHPECNPYDFITTIRPCAVTGYLRDKSKMTPALLSLCAFLIVTASASSTTCMTCDEGRSPTCCMPGQMCPGPVACCACSKPPCSCNTNCTPSCAGKECGYGGCDANDCGVCMAFSDCDSFNKCACQEGCACGSSVCDASHGLGCPSGSAGCQSDGCTCLGPSNPVTVVPSQWWVSYERRYANGCDSPCTLCGDFYEAVSSPVNVDIEGEKGFYGSRTLYIIFEPSPPIPASVKQAFMYFGVGSVASQGSLFSLGTTNCTKTTFYNCTSRNSTDCLEGLGDCATLETQRFYGNGTGLWINLPTTPVFTMVIYLTQTFSNQAYSEFFKEGIYISYPG